MKIVTTLLVGQYLSTAYDFYASKASADFATMDPALVGTSMASSNNLYCAHLSIDGSFNLMMGRLPDRVWGLVWRTAKSSQGLSVTRTGVKPGVVYTLLLDTDGALKVQASGSTIWKSPAPASPPGACFAQITDDGALTLTTGTPSNPGSQYWTSGTDQCTLIIDRTAGSGHTLLEMNVTYYDARGGKPGSLVTLNIGMTDSSRTIHWPAMLAGAGDPGYLASLPVAMTLAIDPHNYSPQLVQLGVCRTLTMSVTDQGCSFPLGFGVAASA